MGYRDWINDLFKSIDRRDADAFTAFLSDSVQFRFGNAPVVKGREQVAGAMRDFFASIKAVRHVVAEMWEQQNAVICHGTVTYTRHDSTALTVPFADIFKMDGDRIGEYRIYVDPSELYKPS